jgi:hypothetical protein
MKLPLLLACVSLTALSYAQTPPAELPAPKRAVIPRLSETIILDGNLDEGAWSKAAELENFQLNATGAASRVKTQVKLWYDSEALYLGWVCADPDIQATFSKRDSKFWEEEVVEFFATAETNDLGKYFELQWNPLNGQFDAVIYNELGTNGVSKSFHGDWAYTAAGMRSAVQVKGTVQNSDDKDALWSVEVRIPFADLKRPVPKKGEIWRANFYRFERHKDKEPEELAWSPTRLPGFHQPTRFGYLEFK